MSHPAGATSSTALPPPGAALCSHFWIHCMLNCMLLQWRHVSSALHRRYGVAWARLLCAKDVEAGSRHGGGPGTARARVACLHHSAADWCVQNRMHAAPQQWRNTATTCFIHCIMRARLLYAKDVEAGVLALRARCSVIHDGFNDGDFVPAAREACRLDVNKQQQPAALCTNPLPIWALRRPARKAGMEGAWEQRGRGRPVYAIWHQIDAFKTERTRRKHAYKPTCKR